MAGDLGCCRLQIHIPKRRRSKSATGLEVFDRTLQKSNSWIHDLMQVLRWQDKHKVFLADIAGPKERIDI